MSANEIDKFDVNAGPSTGKGLGQRPFCSIPEQSLGMGHNQSVAGNGSSQGQSPRRENRTFGRGDSSLPRGRAFRQGMTEATETELLCGEIEDRVLQLESSHSSPPSAKRPRQRTEPSLTRSPDWYDRSNTVDYDQNPTWSGSESEDEDHTFSLSKNSSLIYKTH